MLFSKKGWSRTEESFNGKQIKLLRDIRQLRDTPYCLNNLIRRFKPICLPKANEGKWSTQVLLLQLLMRLLKEISKLSEILIWNLHFGLKVFFSEWTEWSAKKLHQKFKLLFHHKIVTYVEKFKIPHTRNLNLDQAPLKYKPVSNETMPSCGSLSVMIEGSDGKRMITETFVITLSGKFLLIQIIYKGEANQSVPRVVFPDGFSLSTNPFFKWRVSC